MTLEYLHKQKKERERKNKTTETNVVETKFYRAMTQFTCYCNRVWNCVCIANNRGVKNQLNDVNKAGERKH